MAGSARLARRREGLRWQAVFGQIVWNRSTRRAGRTRRGAGRQPPDRIKKSCAVPLSGELPVPHNPPMHKLSEGTKSLAITVGATFSFVFFILFLILSADRIARHSGADLLALLLGGSFLILQWFAVGYFLVWAIDWVIAGFRKHR